MENCDLVILSNYGLNSEGGGVKVYTQNFVKALNKKGITIVLLIREGIATEIELKLPKNKILFILAATRKLANIRPKFILSQGGWFTALPAIVYKIKYPGTKVTYLYHTHLDPPKTIKQKMLRFIQKHLMSFIFSKFDCVLFVSEGLRKNIEKAGGFKNLPRWDILYGGVPVINIPTVEKIKKFKQNFNVQKNFYYIVGLGLTALPAKVRGARLLIDALSLLPKNIGLILTRKGRFVEDLRRYAKKRKVLSRVIFTGDLENPHLATSVADIYTHITYGEGLPLALIEVMSIGKPVIASNVGGIPEAIRHPLEGILIENDANKIAQTVMYLIENPRIREKMCVISKKAINKRFSWKRTAEKFLEIVNS